MSLQKGASEFKPKWMRAADPPAPAAAQPQPQPEPKPATAPPVASKLSSTASSFMPRNLRSVAAPKSPVPAPKQPVQGPSPAQDLGPAVAVAPQGVWGKRPPMPKASSKSPQAKPAKVPSPAMKPQTPGSKPVTPGSKPMTPGGRPAQPGEVYRPPAKTLTAAMAAAKEAKLKADAPVFMPKKFVPPMKMITPPPTPPTAASQSAAAPPAMRENTGEDDGQIADENAIMPLSRPWALYFVDRAPHGQAAFDPTLVYEIKSVEDFWRTINNVPTVTHGNTGSTYYFFRDGILPKWEDRSNTGGGAWTVRLFSSRDLSSEAIDEIWERLLARAVGEAWPTPLKGNLNGLVCKMRDRCITVQFWVTKRVDEMPLEVMNIIGDLYKAFNMDYVAHEAAKLAAEEREKAEAAKAKEAKKKGKKRTY